MAIQPINKQREASEQAPVSTQKQEVVSFSVRVTKELYDRIDDFRFDNRLRSKGEVVVRAIEEFLDRNAK